MTRFALALPAALTLLAALPATAAELTVTVQGVRDTEGNVRVALYDNSESFRHEDKAVAIKTVPAANPAQVSFGELAPGRYAVIAYHDANSNGKLDLFMGMFPAEGWGMTNDPAVFGPPKFDPAAVTVPEDGLAVTVPLHY
ncbi:MAG TPA: DUF2141 domain-containing protein [Magnetospirillum sp.]|nr:DUF2141 domain-containing protein [Magnetospirillum sp.]